MTPGAAWKDVTLGLRALGLFDGCAVVSDIGWVREASRLAGGLARREAPAGALVRRRPRQRRAVHTIRTGRASGSQPRTAGDAVGLLPDRTATAGPAS